MLTNWLGLKGLETEIGAGYLNNEPGRENLH